MAVKGFNEAGGSSTLMNGSSQQQLRPPTASNQEYVNIPWSVDYNNGNANNTFISQPPPPMEKLNPSYAYAIQTDHGDPQHHPPQHQQQTDPQALASLIQQQLEVINDEIEMIQVSLLAMRSI